MYLAASLLLWRLPAILEDDAPVTSHYIPRRLGLLFALNAVIPLVSHQGEPQAWAFILAITGSSTVFVERSNGFHERLITMPAPYAAVPAARIIAEFIRIMAMTAVVAAVAALLSDGPRRCPGGGGSR